MAQPHDNAKRAEAIDAHVGERARLLRTSKSLTHGVVAHALGISIPQLHKYERGVNRFSVGRLYALAKLFRVSVTWFLDGFEDSAHAGRPPPESAADQLLRAYNAIPDPEVQRAIVDFAVIASRVYSRLLRRSA